MTQQRKTPQQSEPVNTLASLKDDGNDLAHWQQELSRVKPLKARPRAGREIDTSIEQKLEFRRAEEHDSVMHEAMYGVVDADEFNTGDEQEFRREHLPRNVLRKLRRGQFAVQATLDVHGLRRYEAHRATQEFLAQALGHNWRCVKIIHGKGLHSAEGIPVLKHRVEITLQHNNDVQAYCSAPNWSGGHGATLVLLRKR